MIKNVLVVGANGGIGSAVASHYLNAEPTSRVYAVSRSASEGFINNANFEPIVCSQDEDAIQSRCTNFISKQITFDAIYICTGFLHDDANKPEKRIEQFDLNLWQKTVCANTLIPMLWLKHLMPLLVKSHRCSVMVLSARVGSIGDNRLGGWYSYRASKSALNMLLKTAAIEMARRAKNIKLIAFHPGTTDTCLSKPFQQNVPGRSLFTADFVAKKMIWVAKKAEYDGKLDYIDWDDKAIEW